MEVDAFLEKGENFFKRHEGATTTIPQTAQSCTLKVDQDGLFLTWCFLSQKEIYTLECTHIREVKTGVPLKDAKAQFEMERGDTESDLTPRVLSIYSGFEIGTLSLTQFVASTPTIAVKWMLGMNKVIHSMKAKFLSPLDIMKKQWLRLRLSVNSKGMIPVKRLVKHFGYDKNDKVVLQKLHGCGFTYSKNDEINPDGFTFEVYKGIHQKICNRGDVDDVFDGITKKERDYIELAQLVTWLNDNQRDPRLNEILVPTFDEKAAINIIQKHEKCIKNCKNDRLSKKGFSDYLASNDNMLIYPDHVRLHHDMDQPLSHYFINSSHNTYLPGRQFGGKSSIDMYRHVLLMGCRCIELDCWDGKGEFHGEPIITHGKAMCSDILFKNVLIAIKESAFITSEYPVILSFETHCSKPLQAKMAKYCEEVFGELLLGKCLDSYPLEPGVLLPSPNALKRKILIKNKRLDAETEKVELESARTEMEVILDEETEEAHPELQFMNSNESKGSSTVGSKPYEAVDECTPKPLNQRVSSRSLLDKPRNSTKKTSTTTNMLTEDDEDDLVTNYEYKKPTTVIHPYLSSMVNYCQSVKFPGFKKIEDENQKMCFQMSSFSESQGLNHIKTSAVEFVNYNQLQLSRIYPRGNRVDSSNYVPQIFWDAGCQLVSLNFQTSDLGFQLNSGKFDYNGGCGYLLKPEVLLKRNKSFDLFAQSTMDGVIAAQCGVKIISAQFLSDKPITSYVEVDMYGLPHDTIRKEFRTTMAIGNGLNPQYNNEFLFRKVTCPDLALLRFTLYDDSRQLLGQRGIPFSSLQAGYRYVTLRSASGVPLDSATLFVKITLKSYVPDILIGYANALENPKAHLPAILQHEDQLKCFEDDENDPTPSRKTESVSSAGPEATNGKATNNKSTKEKRPKNGLSTQAPNASNPHQTVYPKMSDEKKAVDDVIEQTAVSMNTLMSHPVYLKALECHNKQSARQHKKLAKQRSIKGSQTDQVSPSLKCCIFSAPGICRRKSSKTDEVFVQNGTDGKTESSTDFSVESNMSPDKKKTALIESLLAVHKDASECLTKLQTEEMASLTQKQTKNWMDTEKLINKDKSIPHAERERQIRDFKSLKTRHFLEERRTLNNRHAKQEERLKVFHREEKEKMEKLIEASSL